MENIYTVSKINELIKCSLNNLFPLTIKVEGEISNIKISGNHLFLTLKDNDTCLNAIFWNYVNNDNTILNNGEKIIVEGKITTYGKSSNYNIIIKLINKLGKNGDIFNEYENIKNECISKGYFSRIKKNINDLKNISQIGILTAPDGAALQDILYVLNNNNYKGKIIIKKCIVQGQNCSASVVNGIKYLEQYKNDNGKNLDIILVTRGGGSFEDLMGFSNINVIEALNKCPIFTISAIGHEIDTMLSDYVADLRAPTPSIAAEIIYKQYKKYQLNVHNFDDLSNNFLNMFKYQIEIDHHNLITLKSKIKNPLNIIESYIEKITLIDNNIKEIINDKINEYLKIFENFKTKLSIYDNDHVLKKIDLYLEKILLINTNMVTKINNNINEYQNNLDECKIKLSKYDLNYNLNNGYCLLLNNDILIDSIEKINKLKLKNLKLRLKDGEINILINMKN